MAKRKTKSRRRRNTAISILGVAESYLLLNAATEWFFNVNPKEFLLGSGSPKFFAPASGARSISLGEIFDFDAHKGNTTITLTEQITENAQKNFAKGFGAMVLIPIFFKAGKALARRPIRMSNRMLKQAGVAGTVKI